MTNCSVELRTHRKLPSLSRHASPSLLHLHPEEEARSKEERLRAEALSEKHLRTHFPKNPYCKICSVAKTTSARVAKKPDTKADDLVDAPTKPFQQLATDDVIIAKGDDHVGIGVGGVKTHHVVRDVFSGVRVAYPVSRRGAPQHARDFSTSSVSRRVQLQLHASSKWTKRESSLRQQKRLA